MFLIKVFAAIQFVILLAFIYWIVATEKKSPTASLNPATEAEDREF